MPLAPVDYGPQLQTDNEGYYTARQERDAVVREARQLGSVVEGGARNIVQGRLHTQALQATALVKEKQAGTLAFIDLNPYVNKDVLQQKMSPEDYAAWHAGLASEYKDATAVPMFTAADSLFKSEAKQVRAAAGQSISLPGWREKWEATEKTESATIQERYVNRLAADQMIADQRYQTLDAHDRLVEAAVKPEDIQAASDFAKTSPWLKPAERHFVMAKDLVAKDSFVARQAMLALDTAVMKSELSKLRSDNAAELYPNMNVKQRLDLANQLGREYGFKAAKEVAERDIVGPNIGESGKVDSIGIAEKLVKYDGPNKEGVVQAVKALESEYLDIFNKKTAAVQQSIATAGQDPLTGRFSYAKAMQNPDARKAAFQLNKDAPGLITALSREDQRWEAIDAKADRAEKMLAKAQLIATSQDNLDAIHKFIDDPRNSNSLKNLTSAQFDSQLMEQAMTEQDRGRARTAFEKFQKNGGKPDERPTTIVYSELASAANGNENRTKKLKAAYGDALIRSAHGFIRENPTLPPDKMSDALRAHVKAEMLSGTVLGSGKLFDDTARRIEWETKAGYAGKDFKLSKDGTIIRSTEQRIQLSKDGVSGTFAATDVAAALADGWK
jgi:hypothetical protein